LRNELNEKSRVIDRTDSFVAFCPFASRFAGLVRITSLAHRPHFETFNDAALDQLASFLWRVLTWVDAAFPGRAFNYLLHTCPPGSTQPEAFQWSLDVFPRLNKTAGFEWSSNCMINSLLPEAVASRYREIARQNDPRFVLTAR
jgi:UDPglucose--hexose-1-phosphate uridylyltransferase